MIINNISIPASASMTDYWFYAITTPHFQTKDMYKLGISKDLTKRLSTYMTSCPPLDQYEMSYQITKPIICNHKQACKLDTIFKTHFIKYSMPSTRKTEWYHITWSKLVEEFDIFIRSIEIYTIASNVIQSRNVKLDNIQAPIVDSIITFLMCSDVKAGTVFAPCGVGKTIMMKKSLSIHNLDRIIIIVPTRVLCNQWKNTLSDLFTTNEFQEREPNSSLSRYCCIITSVSSKRLIPNIRVLNPDLIIFDEAHHMAGGVGEQNGMTRQFLQHISTLNLKRIFLTATPRYAQGNAILSMDDEVCFGKIIASIDYGHIVREDILPHPILHIINNPKLEHNELNACLSRAHILYDAWTCPNFHEGQQLHHLVIFVRDHMLACKVYEYLMNADMQDTKIIYLYDTQDVNTKIKEFESAKRGILINCKVLSEGITISCLDSVSILYNIRSSEFAIQALLRAGRFFPNKKNFHILLPGLDEQTNIFIQNIMQSLLQGSIPVKRLIVGEFATRTSITESSSDGDVDADPEQLYQCMIHPNLKLIKCILKHGNTSLIEYFNNMLTHSELSRIRAIDIAIENGHLELVHYLRSRDLQITCNLYKVIERNDLAMLKYLVPNILTPCSNDIEYAISCGQIEILKYFVSIGVKLTHENMRMGIINNNAYIIEMAIDEYNAAIRDRRTDIVEYLIESGLEVQTQSIAIAVANVDINIDPIMVKVNANAAMQNGDIQLLKSICSCGIMPDIQLYLQGDVRNEVIICVLELAIKHNNLEVFRILSQYPVVNKDIMDALLKNGEIGAELVRWYMKIEDQMGVKAICNHYLSVSHIANYVLGYDIMLELLDKHYISITKIALHAIHENEYCGIISQQYLNIIKQSVGQGIIPYNYYDNAIIKGYTLYNNAELLKFIENYELPFVPGSGRTGYTSFLKYTTNGMRKLRRMVELYV